MLPCLSGVQTALMDEKMRGKYLASHPLTSNGNFKLLNFRKVKTVGAAVLGAVEVIAAVNIASNVVAVL